MSTSSPGASPKPRPESRPQSADTTQTIDTPEAGLRFCYALGWSFTPLSGKRPILDKWTTRPRETADEAAAWLRAGNIGLRTGRTSGVVAIDADKGADLTPLTLPATVTVDTGGGGRHYYYRHDAPLGNSSGKLGPHIDVKADGGQVVFPGSTHPKTGEPYRWAAGCEPWSIPLATLPAAIVERLTASAKPRPATDTGRYAAKALAMECASISAACEGTRNDALNRAAFSLGTLVGAGALARGEVESALHEAASAAGLPDAEIRATIRSGITAGIAQPRAIPDRPYANAAEPEPPGCEGREPTPERSGYGAGYVLTPGPHVTDTGEYVEQSAADFARDVLARLPAEAIYRRDCIPGELTGERGRIRWRDLSTDRLRLVVDAAVKLGKWATNKEGESSLVYQSCSRDRAGLILAGASVAATVRDLRLIVNYPVYGPGFVRAAPGWNDCGIFYDQPEALADLTPELDCEVIHNTLHDLVIDFPFKSHADRQNYFGLLLTPIIAPAVSGNRPMHLINSPLERTGKSKLANEVFGGIIAGRDTPSMQITEREEEREKRILAQLLYGDTLLHLDNLPHYIDSPALASLLTAQRFGGRLLGQSRNVTLDNVLVVVGTGNNVRASGELVKRCVPIDLEPATATPEARTDYQYADLRGHVQRQRRDVLGALLGLVENWLASGRPGSTLPRLGGFEAWSDCVGGIMRLNGFAAWRTNEPDWRAAANPEGEEFGALAAAWWSAHGTAEIRVADVLELCKQAGVMSWLWGRGGEQGAHVSLGRTLERRIGAPVGSWRLAKRRGSDGVRYRLDLIISGNHRNQ